MKLHVCGLCDCCCENETVSPSEGGRLRRPRHCSQCAARAQSCVSQWFSWKHILLLSLLVPLAQQASVLPLPVGPVIFILGSGHVISGRWRGWNAGITDLNTAARVTWTDWDHCECFSKLASEWYELYGIAILAICCAVSRYFYCHRIPRCIVTLAILLSSRQYRRWVSNYCGIAQQYSTMCVCVCVCVCVLCAWVHTCMRLYKIIL